MLRLQACVSDPSCNISACKFDLGTKMFGCEFFSAQFLPDAATLHYILISHAYRRINGDF